MKCIKALNVDRDIMVDDEDYEWLINIPWKVYTKYAERRDHRNLKYRYMHQIILDKHGLLEPGKQTDHINGNGLDNRKRNLRQLEQSANLRNRQGNSGIYWRERQRQYQVTIGVNYHLYHVGLFRTFGEAREARLLAEELVNKGADPNRLKELVRQR